MAVEHAGRRGIGRNSDDSDSEDSESFEHEYSARDECGSLAEALVSIDRQTPEAVVSRILTTRFRRPKLEKIVKAVSRKNWDLAREFCRQLPEITC